MKIKNIIGYDAIKVQNEIMQGLFDGKGQIMSGDITIMDENYFTVCFNGHVLYIMPEMFCYIDREKIYKSRGNSSDSLKKIVNTAPKQEEAASDTRTTIKNTDGKTLRVFQLKDGNKIYFDEKLLKPFGDGFTLAAKSPKSPAGIYYGDLLIGIVCPVNYREV